MSDSSKQGSLGSSSTGVSIGLKAGSTKGRSILSFSAVNAVNSHELDFEPILLFQQCACDDLKLKSRGRRQLVAETKYQQEGVAHVHGEAPIASKIEVLCTDKISGMKLSQSFLFLASYIESDWQRVELNLSTSPLTRYLPLLNLKKSCTPPLQAQIESWFLYLKAKILGHHALRLFHLLTNARSKRLLYQEQEIIHPNASSNH